MRGKTGDICKETGPYKCDKHEEAILFVNKGDKFPYCPASREQKGHETVWYMLSES